MLKRAMWLVLGLSTVAFTMSNFVTQGRDPWSLAFLGFGVVGTFVGWKVPGHIAGPLMIGLSAVSAAGYSEAVDELAAPVGWASIAMPLLMGVFLLTFPSGHLSRQWWRPTIVAASVVFIAGVFVASQTGDEGPYIIVPLTAFVFGALLDLVFRYRGANREQKAQMKLVMFAAIAAAVAIVVPGLVGLSDDWLTAFVVLGFTLIPVAVGWAILKYRLFDIDRIISRTVAYALTVALLGLVFAAGVVWLPSALGLHEQSPLLVAATTLLVAALFNPLRRRVLESVDRRFNRNHYQPRLIEERFTAELQKAHTGQELTRVWLETVDHALGPQASGIWLKSNGQA